MHVGLGLDVTRDGEMNIAATPLIGMFALEHRLA
jgi:hypothetical protein